MTGAGKKKTHKKFEKSLHTKNGARKSPVRRHKLKAKSHKKTVGLAVSKEKVIDIVSKGTKNDSVRRHVINKANQHKNKSSKKQSSLITQPVAIYKEDKSNAHGDVKTQKLKKRRKHKRQKGSIELDDASRLQRRAKYLLIKMKLEQNLIDAYSTEGWKGQSREKIKPEKELQRAKKQILKCKIGILDAIRQLDLLGSVGHIEDSVIAPDGSVHHEHIICAKCKSQEAFPDNDIILCDGTCNCAFHQKCLDPPLSTENIPQGDQGWLCKFCDYKMEILEAMNAHLGTCFSLNSSWQEIFKEEAALPDGEGDLLFPEQEWPSDDSEDDDYDPENFKNGNSYSTSGSEVDASDDASSSSSLWSLDGEVFSESGRSEKRWKGCQNSSLESIVGVDSEETTDCEIICGRRQRKAVDYLKLNDVLFGKNASEYEQISEDEDWGPSKRKRREKESDAASTLMTLCESEKKCSNLNSTDAEEKLSSQTKRSFFRIPPNAVEKLRLVFAENELPSRTVKENLSKQLGLDSEKVNKWFKNARYLALKARKAKRAEPVYEPVLMVSRSEIGKDNRADQLVKKDVSSAFKNFRKFRRRKNPLSLISSSKRKRHRSVLRQSPCLNKASVDCGDDDVSLKVLREKAKRDKKRVNFKPNGAQEAEAEMERLCQIKSRVQRLKQVLHGLPSHRSNFADAPSLKELHVIYVPVAELREKT